MGIRVPYRNLLISLRIAAVTFVKLLPSQLPLVLAELTTCDYNVAILINMFTR